MTSTQGNTNRWRAFALLAVSYFMTVVDFTIVNVSLPTIGRDLHLSATGLQWVVTAYALTLGGFLLFGGRAADLLGRRRILMLGLALFTAASWRRARHERRGADREPGGAGTGWRHHAARRSLDRDEHVRGGRRAQQGARDLGRTGSRGWHGRTDRRWDLTRYAGWQYIFYLNVPIGVIALALAPRIVPDSRLATTGRRFDVLGAIAGTGGLVLLVDAISQAPQYGWGATRTVVLLAASVVVCSWLPGNREPGQGAAVAAVDLPAAHAGRSERGRAAAGREFLRVRVRRHPIHAGGTALQRSADRRAWLAASVTSMALAGVSQLLVTRVGPRIVMAIGMTLIGTGIIWATQAPVHGHFVANLIGPFIVAGAGTAFSFIPISVAALAGVAEHQSGLASGLLNTSTQFGAAIGTAVASSVAASGTNTLLHAGDAAARALTGGFHRLSWCWERSR